VGVTIGQDTTIYPNTALRGSTVIGEDCHIGPDTTLVETEVGDATLIQNSVAEYARVGNHVSIGPFCHLRKGAVLMDGVHMGNFGEVKASTLGENVKMGHFSYIGDAKVGSNVNIGAGTITCNFDGEKKNLTEIGENAFIGSDTMLVAPVKIGKMPEPVQVLWSHMTYRIMNWCMGYLQERRKRRNEHRSLAVDCVCCGVRAGIVEFGSIFGF